MTTYYTPASKGHMDPSVQYALTQLVLAIRNTQGRLTPEISKAQVILLVCVQDYALGRSP